MSPRRGLALVVTVAVLAGVTTSAAAATAPAGPARKAAKPTICVALVVDGRSLGSDVRTSCAKVAKGATGVDVLEAGGHTVGFRHDGLVCTIDGLPKTGCADVDDTHYWAYFHRAPGATTWTYSSEGPSTYQPVNDSTEGWVYDNGSALTPENVPYAKICKPEPKPAPTATPSHQPSSPAPTRSEAVGTPTSTPTAPPSLIPRQPTASKTKSQHQKSKALSTSPVPTTAASEAPTPDSTNAALAGAIPPSSNHHGWLGLLIGLAVVAALGFAAATRFRRSQR